MNKQTKRKQTIELITQAEFARRINVARSWISMLIKKGKLTTVKDPSGRPRLNYDKALIEYKGSKDHNRDPQREWGRKQREEDDQVDLLNPQYGDINCNDDMVGKETQRSKLVRETFEAKLKEVEYLKTKRELIPVDEIKEVNNRIASAVRMSLLSFPTKVAPQLEGLPTTEVQYKLEDEINNILIELSRIGEVIGA